MAEEYLVEMFCDANVWQLTFDIDKCAVLSGKDPKHYQAQYLCDQRIGNVNKHPYF